MGVQCKRNLGARGMCVALALALVFFGLENIKFECWDQLSLFLVHENIAQICETRALIRVHTLFMA